MKIDRRRDREEEEIGKEEEERVEGDEKEEEIELVNKEAKYEEEKDSEEKSSCLELKIKLFRRIKGCQIENLI